MIPMEFTRRSHVPVRLPFVVVLVVEMLVVLCEGVGVCFGLLLPVVRLCVFLDTPS